MLLDSVVMSATPGINWMDTRLDQQPPSALASGSRPGFVQSFNVGVVRKIATFANLAQHIDEIAKLTGKLGKNLTESLFEQSAVGMTGK